MCEAMILAAGYASRVGSNKMALPYKESTVIETLIRTLTPYCSQILVITGHYHDALESLLKPYNNIKIIYNQAYDLGMFSSVLCGMAYVTKDVLICPGDYPNIKPKTIESLLDSTGEMVVPSYNRRRGHPILIRKSLHEQLLVEPITSNLKTFRNRHSFKTISVGDKGILQDIDTIKDYKRLKEGGIDGV